VIVNILVFHALMAPSGLYTKPISPLDQF